jgi:hypothetical protein
LDPFELDWGAATPELVSKDRRLALQVVNHDLTDPVNVRRTARDRPVGWRQRVVIDDTSARGGPVAGPHVAEFGRERRTRT